MDFSCEYSKIYLFFAISQQFAKKESAIEHMNSSYVYWNWDMCSVMLTKEYSTIWSFH